MSESPTAETIVIVGAGQAGIQLALTLHRLGYTGRLLLIGEELHLPYKRPPLSKAYLAGTVDRESLHVVPQSTLDKAGIEFIGGVAVTRIDRAAKQIELGDGRKFGYDKLALTTGGRSRPLPLPGADRPNVFLVRTIDNVEALRLQCVAGKHVVVVGGGFIGLEMSAVLLKLGVKVTVLEGLPRVLARVTVPEVSAFYERVHREAGVDLRTNVKIEAFEGEPLVTRVRLGDGSYVDADAVIVGTGQIPNTELAQTAGLAVDNGIVVDEFAQTSDPDIVAAGDCSNHLNTFYGRHLRLESVPNAMEQSRAAAATLLGKPQPYHAVPWFWSDQYELKLQMVGLSAGFDQLVLRGDPQTQRSFCAFYLKDGRLIATDTVSRPQDFMIAKKLVALRASLDAAQLADESVPLESLLPAA